VAARGFTLVELLVAMALLAILATLAMPGFGEYLRNCRRAATVNAFTHAAHVARQLAAVRGEAVLLCPSADGVGCSGGEDWGRELLLLAEAPDLSAAQSPLRVLRSATATLTICDDRGSRAARAVIISRTGRPRVSDLDAGGRPLACP
jgi:type IV fimbrial biogenesis protein FimT